MHRTLGLRPKQSQEQIENIRRIGRKNLSRLPKVMDNGNQLTYSLGSNVSTHTHTYILTL